MSLSTKSVGVTGQGNSNHIKEGVFVEEVRILKLKDTSGQQLDWMSWTNDLSVYCELEGERELPFTPTFYVGGDFKKGPQGIDGWGGAFLVASFFKTLLGADFELTPENRIPTEVLQAAQGRTFLKVSFQSTKPKSDGSGTKILDWNRIVVREEGEGLQEAKERAADLFIDEYVRSGYPSAYDRAGVLAKASGEDRSAAPDPGGSGDPFSPIGPGPGAGDGGGTRFAVQQQEDELPF